MSIKRLKLISILCLLGMTSVLRGATPKQITDALARGTAYLYSIQAKNGTWETVDGTDPREQKGQYTGVTALAVYALLSAGEKPTDERLARAIQFLKETDAAGIYALGLRCQVWLMLPQTPDVKARMQQDARLLLGGMKTKANAAGMYDYVIGENSAYSHSRSQYGVLGLWAAERSGFKVPQEYWRTVERGWIRNQDRSGGWTYTHPSDNTKNDFPVTPGMTAAGVATLFIAQDYLITTASCKGNLKSEPIDKGMAWIASNMDKFATDERIERDSPFATLYAIERIGVAAGMKHIGGVDWYQKGSDWVIRKQLKSGAWSGGGTDISGTIAPTTSFAMLFLARGRVPLVINKLDYSTDPAKPVAWNQRPREVANAVRWVGAAIERDLNWQSVDLKAPLSDLTEAPIVFLAGSEVFQMTEEHKAKLKAFVESGGLLLGHSDCGKPAFATSFRKLATELYPQYKLRELPADSPVYAAFPQKNWKSKPSVLSMSNGAREIIMLIPSADPGRAWQTREVTGNESSYELLANLVLYTNSERWYARGESYAVTPDPAITPKKTIKLARLRYDGNWDPEPGGWRRLGALMHNLDQLALETVSVELGKDALDGFAIAHLTGTGSISFTEAQRSALRAFVQAGGLLLIDACGGQAEFDAAMQIELAKLFPAEMDQMMSPLKRDHPIYAAEAGVAVEPRYRVFARGKLGAAAAQLRLRGITFGGKLGVIYSSDDLSVGLVGTPVDGIIGLEADTTTQLVRRILRLAAP